MQPQQHRRLPRGDVRVPRPPHHAQSKFHCQEQRSSGELPSKNSPPLPLVVIRDAA